MLLVVVLVLALVVLATGRPAGGCVGIVGMACIAGIVGMACIVVNTGTARRATTRVHGGTNYKLAEQILKNPPPILNPFYTNNTAADSSTFDTTCDQCNVAGKTCESHTGIAMYAINTNEKTGVHVHSIECVLPNDNYTTSVLRSLAPFAQYIHFTNSTIKAPYGDPVSAFVRYVWDHPNIAYPTVHCLSMHTDVQDLMRCCALYILAKLVYNLYWCYRDGTNTEAHNRIVDKVQNIICVHCADVFTNIDSIAPKLDSTNPVFDHYVRMDPPVGADMPAPDTHAAGLPAWIRPMRPIHDALARMLFITMADVRANLGPLPVTNIKCRAEGFNIMLAHMCTNPDNYRTEVCAIFKWSVPMQHTTSGIHSVLGGNGWPVWPSTNVCNCILLACHDVMAYHETKRVAHEQKQLKKEQEKQRQNELRQAQQREQEQEEQRQNAKNKQQEREAYAILDPNKYHAEYMRLYNDTANTSA